VNLLDHFNLLFELISRLRSTIKTNNLEYVDSNIEIFRLLIFLSQFENVKENLKTNYNIDLVSKELMDYLKDEKLKEMIQREYQNNFI
jgi:predicted aldo/keto reductase-like oxidoreductase